MKKIQFSCLMFVFGKKVAGAEQSLKCVKFKLVANKLMAAMYDISRSRNVSI